MKLNLDVRPAESWSGNIARHRDFFAIRLEPNSNDEMAQLEAIFQSGIRPTFQKNIFLNRVEYAICFEPRDK